MRDILAALNDVVGVRGSLVVTHDGMVIAAELGEDLKEDALAAIATAVIRNTVAALREARYDSFVRYDLCATHGRMFFVDTGTTYLVVVMDMNIDIGPAELEIKSAARRIRQQAEIRI
jgi:predicted regulator of Ras-like GTPase activity (Roadblock/LC7/MglB family)